jgi:hypothetical protein
MVAVLSYSTRSPTWELLAGLDDDFNIEGLACPLTSLYRAAQYLLILPLDPTPATAKLELDQRDWLSAEEQDEVRMTALTPALKIADERFIANFPIPMRTEVFAEVVVTGGLQVSLTENAKGRTREIGVELVDEIMFNEICDTVTSDLFHQESLLTNPNACTA